MNKTMIYCQIVILQGNKMFFLKQQTTYVTCKASYMSFKQAVTALYSTTYYHCYTMTVIMIMIFKLFLEKSVHLTRKWQCMQL